MSTLGARVRRAREDAGLSQIDLAGADLSSSYVSLIESDRRRPSARTIATLAARLGVSAEYLAVGDTAAGPTLVRREVAYARREMVAGSPAAAVARITALDLTGVELGLRVQARRTLAGACEQSGDLTGAATRYEDLLADPQVHDGRPLEWLAIVVDAALCYMSTGDLTRAAELTEAALKRGQADGLAGTDEYLRVGAVLCDVFAERGDMLYASVRARELVDAGNAVNTAAGRGELYWTAGQIALDRMDYERGLGLLDRAAQVLENNGPALMLARVRLRYARALVERRPDPDPRTALNQLMEAEPVLEAAGDRVDTTEMDATRSSALLLMGSTAQAETAARTAVAALAGTEDKAGIGSIPTVYGPAGIGPGARADRAGFALTRAYLALADVAVATGRESVSSALSLAGLALVEVRSRRGAGQLWIALGDRHAASGHPVHAADAYRRAVTGYGLPATAVPFNPDGPDILPASVTSEVKQRGSGGRPSRRTTSAFSVQTTL